MAPLILHVPAIEYSARVLLIPQLNHLASLGYRVRLACSPDEGEFGPGLERFDPVAVRFSRQASIRGALRGARSLARVLEDLRPDVLHLHSSSAALAARLLPRRVLGAQPVVFTVHGFPFQWTARDAKSRAIRQLERALSRRTDLLLFQSTEELARSREAGFKGQLEYLGNGVQDHWFGIPAPLPARPVRLLFTGRLIRAKGILDLLTAAADVEGLVIDVAGGRLTTERDDISGELSVLLEDSRLSGRVRMLGHVPPERMAATMAGADVFALPTYHDEGVPRSMIEAMAAGRAVIGTDVRGCRELIENGRSGWLVPPRDIVALRTALEDVAATTPDRLMAMGQAGRQIADDRYRERDVLVRLLEAYRSVGVPPPVP